MKGQAGQAVFEAPPFSSADAVRLGRRNGPYLALVLAAVGWLGLVLLAPWARLEGWLVAPFLYDLFHQVCHQIPERTFHVWGAPLAVCHRCSGLYVGLLVGLLLLPSLDRLRRLLVARPRVVLLFFLPMSVDVALFGLNTPLSRFATGLVASFPVGLLLWLAADGLWRSAVGSNREISVPVDVSRGESSADPEMGDRLAT